MKKQTLLIALIIASIFSFTTTPEYKFTEAQTVAIYSKLVMLNTLLPESDIPAKEASKHSKETVELMTIIQNQYNKFHPDTTKKK